VSEGTVRGRLEGKVILVFGGGRGIGRGCALAIASEGATVVVADLDEANAQAVAGEIGERGAVGTAAHCDVVNRAQVKAVIDDAASTYGHVDGVINLAYAGVARMPLEELTVELLERELQVGVVGSFNTMMLAMPELKKSKGAVVNFASGAGIEGTPSLGAYAATKQGIRGLSLVAAHELGVHGVRINTVCPLGLSPAAEAYYEHNPDAYATSVAKVPLRRYGDCELDIGKAVAFLVSDDARFVTGQTVMLDGGTTHL
jgi:NAD(P)-dependent dehydrogenase (short-subunit alcohol dehydrogenase family)